MKRRRVSWSINWEKTSSVLEDDFSPGDQLMVTHYALHDEEEHEMYHYKHLRLASEDEWYVVNCYHDEGYGGTAEQAIASLYD